MADEEEKKPEEEKKDLEASEENAEGEGKSKRSKLKKIILFVVLPLVLLILIIVGLMLSGVFSSKEPETPSEEVPAEGQEIGAEENLGVSFFYEIPEILVNLSSNSKRTTFLKMTVNLEVGKQEDFVHLDKILPKVIDNFQVYLRELRPEDLRGSQGIYRLREELLLRVNLAAKPVVVRDVLFLNILTQ